MPKKKSSLMAYFLNIGTVAAKNWAALGKGINSLPVSYNPQTSTETDINADNATTSVDSYQVSAGLDISLWDADSAPAHAFLESLRRTRAVGSDAEVEILEVDLSTGSPYTAQLNSAVVAIDSLTVEGGKPQKLSVKIYYNGDPVNGTVVITSGTPVFTATSVSAITLTAVPVDGATAVARSSSITLTFNNKIKAESISLCTAAGVLVPFSRSWNAAKTVLTLTPSATMTATTMHLLTVAGVMDINGQSLATAVIKFTTAS